ncbi:hypothetical protein [Paludisphaera borealis]|uniref:Uncharacterized protein n=1 Tax=Paludisphaera borealis TaxID=1387353 RepID=A0A1U7CKS1_9BACT|nr:hypothetical protein [Paludisphaera borealis]APW59506.1 hypothetical protein BSF38_00930 [Paludisphaera borealis]
MRLIGFERWGRWGIGALLLLLSHGLFMTRSAQAGCDHLASARPPRWSIVYHLDALVAGGSSTSLPADPAREPQAGEVPKAPAPCSGPGCSSQDPAPASTVLPDTDHFDRWGDLSILAIVPIMSRWTRTVEGSTARPTGRKPSIFHPPPRRLADRSIDLVICSR